MRKVSRQILSLALVLMLVMSLAVPAFAASITPQTGTQTVYAMSANGGWTEVMLAYGSKKFSIKRSDISVVKSGNTAGAKLIEAYNSYSGTDYEYYTGSKWSSGKYANYTTWAQFSIQKEGSARIKYKLSDKTYSLTLNVLKYKNPVKTITMNGVFSGKNFSSKTKTDGTLYNLKMSGNSDATLKVNMASGWLLTQVRINDQNNGRQINFNDPEGMTKATLNWGKTYSNHTYQIHLSCRNKSTGAMEYINYYFNQ